MSDFTPWREALSDRVAPGFPMTPREAAALESMLPLPENPDIRADGFVYPEEQAAVDAAKRVLLEEMQRAGALRGPNKNGYGFAYSAPDIEQMAESIVAGTPSSEAKDAMSIMELGRGMDLDPKSLDPVIFPGGGQGMPSPAAMGVADRQIAGMPLQQIWENQRKGWDGYGWTGQKIKALGRNPEPRELSQGGRAAWDWRNNELLLRGLLDQGDNPAQPGAPAMQNRFKSLNAAVRNYEQNRDRTHGESGYLRAMQNQEYPAGRFLSLLDTFPEAAHATQIMSPVTGADIRFTPGVGPSVSPAKAGQWIANFVTKGLPEAADQRDIRKYGYAVEPILPAEYDPEQGTKVLREALLADAPNYDLWYRAAGPGKKDGTWPTYAGSTAATFANGFLDPSFLATGPARGIVQRAGLSLLRAGRNPMLYGKLARHAMGGRSAWLAASPSAKTLSRTMRGYGARLATDAADATFVPVARPGLSEAIEELPTSAALMAGMHVSADKSHGPPVPGLPNWFSSKGRTDKYIQDPETGDWREPTQEEVEAQYAEAMKNFETARRSRPPLVRQLRDSMLKPPKQNPGGNPLPPHLDWPAGASP